MMSSTFKNINVVWMFFLVVILVLTMTNGLYTDYDTVGFIAVSIHAFFAFIFLTSMPIKGAGIIAGGFVARIVFMLWDLNASHIFLLPNSGGDTELYYTWATIISEDTSYLTEKIRGGLYSKILGVIFYFTGPMRILGQYINVLLGVSIVVIIYKTMLELKINNHTTRVVLILACFLPNSLIMSAILLREILPTFFVALSVLWFVRWYKYQAFVSFVFSIVMLGLASMFHSGVIGIAIGYLLMYLFYSHKSQKFVISLKNVLKFIPIVAFVFLFTTQFGDAMFVKFANLEEEGVYGSVRTADGGAAYLEGLTINNPAQLLIYGPIRAFYFLFSPLPIDWRGLQDIITFMIDSIVYFLVFYYFLKNKKWFKTDKKLIFSFLITILIVAFVFGIGVSNSGTAMRHRQKLIPLFLIFLATMKHEKYMAIHFIKNAAKDRLN